MKRLSPYTDSTMERAKRKASKLVPRRGVYKTFSMGEKRLYNKTVKEFKENYGRNPKEIILIKDIAFDTVRIDTLGIELHNQHDEAKMNQLLTLKEHRNDTIKLLSTFSKAEEKSFVGVKFYEWREKVRRIWNMPSSKYKDLYVDYIPKDGKQRRYHKDGITRTK